MLLDTEYIIESGIIGAWYDKSTQELCLTFKVFSRVSWSSAGKWSMKELLEVLSFITQSMIVFEVLSWVSQFSFPQAP